MKKILIAAALMCSMTFALAAKPATGAAPDAKVNESCPSGIKVATGAPKKGYANTYANMRDICGAQVNLCQVNTSGGLENLPLLSRKGADIATAQMDTLQTMAKGDENIRSLQVVLPLNYNYLHIVRKTAGITVIGEKKWGFMDGDKKTVVINKFSDLKGQRVVLVGSARLLGPVLNNMFKEYRMIFTEVGKDTEAFEMVKSGAVAAAFTLAGVPHGAVADLTAASGLSLVTFDEDVPGPYVVRTFNYDNVGAYNVKALAVQNVLLTRPFGEEKMAQVQALKACIVANLQKLKDGEYEPAWNEMKVDANVDWQKMQAPTRATAQAEALAKPRKK